MKYLIYLFPLVMDIAVSGILFIAAFRFSEAQVPAWMVGSTMAVWALIYTALAFAGNSTCHRAFFDRVGCYVNEAVCVNTEVIKLGRNVCFTCFELFSSLKESEEVLPCVVGNLLRTDKSVKGTVTVKGDNTVVGCRRYNVNTARLVNCNRNRLIYAVIGKHFTCRFGNDIYKVTKLIEYNDTGVTGIRYKNLISIYENAAGSFKGIGNTEFVGKFRNNQSDIEFFISNNK